MNVSFVLRFHSKSKRDDDDDAWNFIASKGWEMRMDCVGILALLNEANLLDDDDDYDDDCVNEIKANGRFKQTI